MIFRRFTIYCTFSVGEKSVYVQPLYYVFFSLFRIADGLYNRKPGYRRYIFFVGKFRILKRRRNETICEYRTKC